jgi:hypothetical protein
MRVRFLRQPFELDLAPAPPEVGDPYSRRASSSARLMMARNNHIQSCDDLASRSHANCPLRTRCNS